MLYKIDFVYDENAEVWVATSEDIPGLVLESGSIDALIERLKVAIPELLELNNLPKTDCFNIHATRTVPAYG